MATVTIGGQEYTTKPLKFKQLKKAFPLIKQSQELFQAAGEDKSQVDPIAMMETAIAILAIALERDHPEFTVEKLEEELDMKECQALQETIVEIVTESGFEAARPGEGAPAEGAPASPSTGTSTE